MQKRYLNLLIRFIVSLSLAFPLSGITIALVGLARSPTVLFYNPSGELLTFVAGSLWFGIFTPICGGFPFSDETGINRINMYPYIIPTACMIFFLLSKGWRWFKTPLSRAIALSLVVLLAGSLCYHVYSEVQSAEVFVHDKDAPKEIRRLSVGQRIDAVAWNADGSRLAALSKGGGTVTVWETKNWTKINEFQRAGGGYGNNSLSFLPDGSLLTAAPRGNYKNTPLADPKYDSLEIFSLIQWNPETGKPVRYLPELGYPPKDISVKVANIFVASRDGSLIAGFNEVQGGVSLFDGNDGSLIRILKVPPTPSHPDMAMSVAFAPDGQELAIGTLFGALHFFSLRTGEIVRSVRAYEPFFYGLKSLAYSPDGKFIAIGKYVGGGGQLDGGVWLERSPDVIAITVRRTTDGTLVSSLPGSMSKVNNVPDAPSVASIAWSPNGLMLAVGDPQTLRLWRVGGESPKLLLNKPTAQGAYSTAFSLQGMLAVTDNNQIVLYQ